MALSVSSVVRLRKVHHAWLVSLPKSYVPAAFLCAEHYGLASTTRASIQAVDKPVAHRRPTRTVFTERKRSTSSAQDRVGAVAPTHHPLPVRARGYWAATCSGPRTRTACGRTAEPSFRRRGRTRVSRCAHRRSARPSRPSVPVLAKGGATVGVASMPSRVRARSTATGHSTCAHRTAGSVLPRTISRPVPDTRRR